MAMSSYFRKIFASPPSSLHSSSGSSESSPKGHSYTSPTKSHVPPPLAEYHYSTKTTNVGCRDLDSSLKSTSKLGWNEKSVKCDDSKEYNGYCYQYPAKADQSAYSQTPSRSSSASSFESPSSNSSSSSLSSVHSSCSGRKLSSVLKCSPSNSPRLSLKSKCRVSFTNPCKAQPVHMHPLFAMNHSRPAPLQYDVSASPTTGNTLDFLNKKIPMCTLLESATEPPTRGKLTITSDEFPWPIVVHASGNATTVDATGRPVSDSAKGSDCHSSPTGSARCSSTTLSETPSPLRRGDKKFYIDSSDSDDDDNDELDLNDAVVSNLDVLCAIHSTLARGICQDEWDALGDGDSMDQRRIARAYRRRCSETGGNLADGVKRIDFLKRRTVLVGIKSRKGGDPNWREGVLGKLVFAEER